MIIPNIAGGVTALPVFLGKLVSLERITYPSF